MGNVVVVVVVFVVVVVVVIRGIAGLMSNRNIFKFEPDFSSLSFSHRTLLLFPLPFPSVLFTLSFEAASGSVLSDDLILLFNGGGGDATAWRCSQRSDSTVWG